MNEKEIHQVLLCSTTYSYRGKSPEELIEMSIDTFFTLTGSKMKKWFKNSFNEKHMKLYEECLNQKRTTGNHGQTIRTHLREMVVLPGMVGCQLEVYNGRRFVPLCINPSKIGSTLGEFVMTERIVRHGRPGYGATRHHHF